MEDKILEEIVEEHKEESKVEENKPKEKKEKKKTKVIKKKEKTMAEIIKEGKEKYGRLWKIDCGNHVYIVKDISRPEYNEAVEKAESMGANDIEEMIDYTAKEILRTCVLYPEDWEEKASYGKTLETISNEILNNSGFFAFSKEL